MEMKPIVWGKAAGELKNFLGNFKALSVLADSLEEVFRLEKHVERLQQEESRILESIQEGPKKAVAEAESLVEKLKMEEATLSSRLGPLRESAAAAEKKLADLNLQLADRQDALEKIEDNLNWLRRKLG